MVIVKSCRYTHPEIGPIYVRVNANSRCIRARWVGPELHITIPRNLPADEYERFIYDFGQKIKEAKPRSRYHAGQIIDGNYADFEIRISDSKAVHGSFISQEDNNPRRGKKRNYTLNISDKLLECLDFGTPRLENFINSMLIMCGEGATSDFIVPRARQHAAAIGHAPLGWDVKDSKTRLGCCSSRGIITLSPPTGVPSASFGRLYHISRIGPPERDEPLGGIPSDLRQLLRRTRGRIPRSRKGFRLSRFLILCHAISTHS